MFQVTKRTILMEDRLATVQADASAFHFHAGLTVAVQHRLSAKIEGDEDTDKKQPCDVLPRASKPSAGQPAWPHNALRSHIVLS